jgi:hypothetical protein
LNALDFKVESPFLFGAVGIEMMDGLGWMDENCPIL